MNKNYKGKSKEEKREEVKNIMNTLEAGVKNVFSSEKYKECLAFFSKFHNYSFNNSILIAMQCPQASQVASFATWKKLGIKVKKGSKAIKILCPVPYSYIKEEDTDEGKKEVTKSGLTFKLGNVFDVSQTDGEAPSLVNKLKGNSDEMKNLIEKIIKKSDIPIEIDAALNDKPENGYYSLVKNDIHIKESLDDAHKIKTIVHELAHSKLHSLDKKGYTRNEAEVQAESVAFVTCNYIGLDTSDYSFGYIASWSSGKNTKELKASLNIIEKASKELISFIETL